MLQDSDQQGSAQSTKPSFFKRRPILSALLLAIIIIVVLTFIGFLVLMSTFFAIGNSCNQRTQQLDSAASSLERNLQTLTIDNTPPNKVEARKNGDCLTGSGVVGTAEFYLPYSSVTLANSQVTKALNYTGTQESQSFILGNHDNDSQVDFIQTKLPSKDGKIYEVNYYFVSSIYCPDHEYESSVCIDTNPPNDSRSHLSDSVQRIEVISREGG